MPRQQGAALVIALILLLVLTVLAVSGMNSASVELLMSGNEQYRQTAFRAAETGIEQAMRTGTFIGTATTNVTDATAGYDVSITPQLNGDVLSSEAGHDFEVAGSIHYLLQSTGTASRGARSINQQGLAQLVPRSPGDLGRGRDTPTSNF